MLIVASAAVIFMYMLSPAVREIAIADEYKTVVEVHFIGGKVSFTFYQYDELYAIGRSNITKFITREPVEAYVFTVVGYIFGVFAGNLWVVTVDEQVKMKPLIKNKLTYRILTWYSAIGSIMGLIGMMLYRNMLVELKETFPNLQYTYAFYIITIVFIISIIYSSYRIIRPKYEFRYKTTKNDKTVIEDFTDTKERNISD